MTRYYFDHNATTPVSPEVFEAMAPLLREDFGNASSIHHYGQRAKQHLETARWQMAGLIHAEPQEIVFLSGGTEADNLALFGVVRNAARTARHLIATAIEHPAVLGACAQLEREGVEVTRVPVSPEGVVDPDAIRRALRPSTVLISVMHANNELGTVQPIAEIARIAREAGVVFHSDGVQALGKIPVDVAALGVDLYSVSGHKVYAPKGEGALFVRKGTPIGSIQFGGHHERDRRPGTENVPGAVALGRAAEWLAENGEAEAERLRGLRDRLEAAMLDRVPGAGVNGGGAPRTPNTSSMYFDGIRGEALVIALDLKGFAVSSGAACSSGAVEPSHVLTAIGLSADRARGTIRFSLGRLNTAEQVEALVEAVAEAVGHLRRLAPAERAHA
ncbi:MAG: cysteine desulfurase family protein [Bryobacteraceae bacterium]|jgi:cysteine desulfurase